MDLRRIYENKMQITYGVMIKQSRIRPLVGTPKMENLLLRRQNMSDIENNTQLERAFDKFKDQRSLKAVENEIISLNREKDDDILQTGKDLLEIEENKLYLQAGKTKLNQYLDDKMDDFHLTKQMISDYKKIADNYYTYKEALDAVGFEVNGNVYKLRYLADAISTHSKAKGFNYKVLRDVCIKCKDSTFKDFQTYSRPATAKKTNADVKISNVDKDIRNKYDDECKLFASLVDKKVRILVTDLRDDKEKAFIVEQLASYRINNPIVESSEEQEEE